MRLTAIILLTVCLTASAHGFAQTITLSEKNASLEEIFKEIKKQTGYDFIYENKLLQRAKKVDIEVRSATIEEVLNICFKEQPLTWLIAGKIIVVKAKEESPKAFATSEQPYIPARVDISGKITNEEGEPLAGANVKVKGTDKGATTNSTGLFILNGVDESATLEISFVGYQTITVAVNNRTSISATLKLNVITAPEVIVTKGYYNEMKRLSTGDVSTVSSKEIEKQPINNPLLALEGRVTGMEVNQSTGLPGTGVKFEIRGHNSLSQGNDPLFIIDGVPYPSANLFLLNGNSFLGYGNNGAGSPLSNINPADIESITILKDADATAIYGSRGANGVVLITTKKGKPGKIKADVNFQCGIGKVGHTLDVLNTRQYLDMRYEAFKNDGAIPNPNFDYDLMLWDTTRYTDWQKTLIGNKSRYLDVQTFLSGGSQNVQYRIGTGYHHETTVFPGDFYDNKGFASFNIASTSSNNKFRIQFSGDYTTEYNHLLAGDFTQISLMLPPNAPPLYNEDGSINWAPNQFGVSTWPGGNNPIALLNNKYNINSQSLLGNAVINYDVATNLDLKVNLGYSAISQTTFQKDPISAIDPSRANVTTRISGFSNSLISNWIWEPQISYHFNLKKSLFTTLLGYTRQQSNSDGQSILASGFNSDEVMQDIKSATNLLVTSSSLDVYKYDALFGRINYNFADKYIVNFTGRRDGSSRFGPANRFHNFGAVGMGWVFSKERLIEKIFPFLSFGKLRASYGTTGSDQVGDYSFMDLYTSVNYGVPYQGGTALYPSRIYTPDLQWEETKKIEAGLELGFFHDKVVLSSSVYRHRSSNQLTGYSLPTITGFTSVNKNLNALIQNEGIELELKTENIYGKNFTWTSFINITINKNKLVSGSNGLNAFYNQKIGYLISTTFVYQFLGVDPITGQYYVADAHGSPTNNPDNVKDAIFPIDQSTKFYGGLGNTLTYKNIQLEFLFQFVKRPNAVVYLYNGEPGYFSSPYGGNQPIDVLNRWQKPGDVKPIQKFSQNTSTINSFINAENSNQLYGDGSYIRLKNISLSWQISKKALEKIHVQNASIYVHCQNLLTVTKYKGLDPETLSSISLPPLRVITVGVQLNL